MGNEEPGQRIEFTDLISVNGNLVQFSPTGALIAICYTNKILVRRADSLEVATILTTIDKITQFQWSSDSSLILAVMATRNKVQVFDLTSPKWECTVDAGLVGIDHAYFSPDGRSVICVAEFNIIMTIFSLLDKSVKTIEWPKGAKECLKFTPDGALAIIGERKSFKDAVAVIKLSDWSLDTHFHTDTNDFQMIRMNGDGAVIALVDPLPHPQILLYLINGDKKAQIDCGTMCAWSPTSQFLAIPSMTEILLFNTLTWSKTTAFSPFINEPVCVYEEHGPKLVLSQNNFNKYMNDSENTNEMNRTKFSSTAKYVACVQGRSLQIYQLAELKLKAVLFLKNDIRSFEWSPLSNRLLATANNSNIYMWSEEGAIIVQIPYGQFMARGVQWAPDGKSAILMSKDKCSVAYLDCLGADPVKNKENIPNAQMKALNIINNH